MIGHPFRRHRLVGSLLFLAGIFLAGSLLGATGETGHSEPAQSESLVSMDFRKTEIGDVLRLLAKQYNLNIILAEDIKGPISVQFSNVTIDEALEAIITVNGFAYSDRGTVIRVMTAAAAAKETEREVPVTQVFPLQYANAKRLVDSMTSVLSKEGNIQSDERSNSLVITDIPSALRTVQKLMEQLDTPTPQVLIETKIIETVLEDNERLGINWDLVASLQGAAQPTTFPIPQRVTSYLRKFQPFGQTASESTTTSTATGATSTATATAFPTAEQGISFPFVSPGTFTYGTVSFNQFKILIQALEARAKTKALAAPSITTLDNQEAQIVIGSNVPVPRFAQSKNTGEYEITGYSSEKIGVILKVTPHVILNKQLIQLDIHPQVSTIERFVGDPRAQVPVTSTREADTRVSLKNGETVVIGGLINERDVLTKRGIPLLGDLPWVGRLFRFDEKTKARTDLMIFITAHILTDEQRLNRTLSAVGTTDSPEGFPPHLRTPPVQRKQEFPLNLFHKKKDKPVDQSKPFKIQFDPPSSQGVPPGASLQAENQSDGS